MKASNREAIEEQIIADYVVTSLGRLHAVRRSRRRRARGVARARGRDERPLGRRPGGRRHRRDRRHRAGHDRRRLRLRLAGRRRRACSRRSGRRTRSSAANYAEDHDISRRRRADAPLDRRPGGEVTVVGHVRAAAVLPAARERQRLDAALRLALRPSRATAGRGRTSPASRPTRAAPQMEAAISGFPDTQLETREEWIEREDAGLQRVHLVPLRDARRSPCS